MYAKGFTQISSIFKSTPTIGNIVMPTLEMRGLKPREVENLSLTQDNTVVNGRP